MADQHLLDLLNQGVAAWNAMRKVSRKQSHTHDIYDLADDLALEPLDLSGANLTGQDFSDADLTDVNLANADLSKAKLCRTDFSWANLNRVNFYKANLGGAHLANAYLSGANLHRADLRRTKLCQADLSNANFTGATLFRSDLRGANLSGAILVNTNLKGSNLTDCSIYGLSAWNVQLEHAIQSNLIITRTHEFKLTVGDLEVAQFIYLLLNNQKIRQVIDTITSKVVLILGRFTPERKRVLDALRDELRKKNYLPLIFDFEKPTSRDLTETVSTLAHLVRFIIVDLTDPSSAPHEVATIIPQTIVPVQPLLTLQPLIIDGKAVERHEYAMFEDLRRRYHWVLPTFRYQNIDELLDSLQAQIIAPAEQKARELTQPK